MRRLLALVLVAAAGALVGCGGGGGGGALESELSYLPKHSPFVVAIDTDVHGDQYKRLGGLVRKVPLAALVAERLKSRLEQGDVSFERDIKPQLGNPFVVGALDARSFLDSTERNDFVGAIKSKDRGKLKQFVRKGHLRKVGTRSGADVYEGDNGNVFAIDGDVLVVAGSRRLLEDAVDRSDGDDKFDKDSFDGALRGLPDDALVRAYVDVQGLLRAGPGGRRATAVKWVGALRKLGLTAAAEPDGVRLRFRLTTDGKLEDKDLPIATGDQAPRVITRSGDISLGVRDPAQVADFVLAAGRTLKPGQFEVAVLALEQQLGINLRRDVLDQLRGEATINIAPNGDFGVRAQLRDPAAFRRTLRKVADKLPGLAERIVGGTVGLAKPKAGQNFYALARPNGQSVVFGVVGDALIVSNRPARAASLASSSPVAAAGKGAVVVRADAQPLADALLRQLGPRIGRLGGALGAELFTAHLGQLTGSVSAQTDSLEGDFRLGID